MTETTASLLFQNDQMAREQALDVSKSFIVQAPAGSGKTELLIQRYLKLLARINKPEEIIGITFTKKAANEMRARVIKALHMAKHEPEPESNHARLTWSLAKSVLQTDSRLKWNLLDNPNQIRIQTIDSLCTYLTKQLPMLSNFGSQPEIMEKPTELYREAAREILSHLENNYEWSDAVAILLLHLDNDMEKLYDLLVKLLAKRDQWLPYIHFQATPDIIRAELEETLAIIVSETLGKIRAQFDPQVRLELAALLSYAASNIHHNDDKYNIKECLDISDLPDNHPESLDAWRALTHFLMTKNGSKYEWRKSARFDIGIPALSSTKDKIEKSKIQLIHTRYKELLNILNENDALKRSLSSTLTLPNPAYDDRQWEVLHALLTALKIAAAQLRITFQNSGKIDFIENAQGALTALGTHDAPTDLALALDYHLKHILVDEFQDTSASQYNLLQKLIAGWDADDGRTLFVVGDPMQSIYRFREAEVGLFIRMWEQGIGSFKLNPIKLSVNFRSLQPIVEWNNHHFANIFPPANDMLTGAVSYSRSVAHFQAESSEKNIHIKGLIDSDDHVQASHVIQDIKQIQLNHPSERIAILVRSRSHLASILPALKAANLSYRAIDINPLANRQIVIDLLSLTCSLLHIADRISWLAILRAPWCGLELNDLHQLTYTHPYHTIWELIIDDKNLLALSEDGQLRLQKLKVVMQNQLANRDRQDIRTWVETTWRQLGGPATLSSESDLDDANEFFNLLEKTNSHDIDTLKDRISDQYASTDHQSDRLQIMTIHSAKGLEFDTVIIPQLQKQASKNENQLLQWMDQPLANHTGLVLAPITRTGNDRDPIYDFIHKQQQNKTTLEIDRLFYVATTRAKKRLYLYFNTTQNKDGSYKSNPGSLLQKLLPLLSSDMENIIVSNTATSEVATEKHQPSIYRLPLAWKNPISIDMAHASIHQKISGILLKDETDRLIGIISHRILQQLAESAISWWANQPDEAITAYISRHIKQSGISIEDQEPATRRIHEIIAHATSDDKGLWILKPHTESKSEFKMTVVTADKPELLIIDRTFVDENNVRWIIDYKTSVNSKEKLEEFLASEDKKYRQKMETYAEAFSYIENRRIRIGLYFPAIPAWREMA